ncbi:kinesin-associated protein 3 [Pelomyxa schiedti]|nr:kinesin-associated protein 3 [Pelomyxa schiedti]
MAPVPCVSFTTTMRNSNKSQKPLIKRKLAQHNRAVAATQGARSGGGCALNKQVRVRDVSVEVATSSLVVSLDVDVSLVDPASNRVVNRDVEHLTKKIPLKITEHTNVELLVEDVIRKYGNFFSSQHTVVLRRLLETLKTGVLSCPTTSSGHGHTMRRRESNHDVINVPSQSASMNDLSSYLTKLYGTPEEKHQASLAILELARDSDNLVQLLHSSDVSLLSALGRVMREDSAKSIDLVTSVVYIFYCFSLYPRFHSDLVQSKIGDSCFTAMETEAKRKTVFLQDLKKLQQEVQMSSAEIAPERRQQLARDSKHFQALQKKQEALFTVCLHVLLNMAEDPAIEERMTKRGVVSILLGFLDTNDAELLAVVLTFLKQLSIFCENKNAMLTMGVAEKLILVLNNSNESIVSLALRLLYNLSFDAGTQEKMVALGYIPKLANFLSNGSYQLTTIHLLYHLSIHPNHKEMFSSVTLQVLTQMVLSDPNPQVNSSLIALLLNLCISSRNAHVLCGGTNIGLLVSRAQKTGDPMVVKLLRTLAVSAPEQFVGAIHPLVEMMVKLLPPHSTTTNLEMLIDLISVILCVDLNNMDWSTLGEKFNLFGCLTSVLQQFSVDAKTNEQILCMLMSLVQLCTSSNTSGVESIVRCGLPQLFVSLLADFHENTTLVSHALECVCAFMLHTPTRLAILSHEDFPNLCMQFTSYPNERINALCSNILDYLMEHDPEWEKKIREYKFRVHNNQWLEAISRAHETGGEQGWEVDDTTAFALDNNADFDNLPLSASASSFRPGGDPAPQSSYSSTPRRAPKPKPSLQPTAPTPTRIVQTTTPGTNRTAAILASPKAPTLRPSATQPATDPRHIQRPQSARPQTANKGAKSSVPTRQTQAPPKDQRKP